MIGDWSALLPAGVMNDLPTDCADTRLEAQSADKLLERCVLAAHAEQFGAHFYQSRLF